MEAAAWLAVLLAAAALPLGYVTYRSQRTRKRLEYVTLSNTELLSGVAPLDLRVQLGDTVVPRPVLTLVRLVNTGDRAIVPEDFHSDLTVSLPGTDHVVSALVARSRPRDLAVELGPSGDTISVRATLINPGELLELQVLSSGARCEAKVGGRIADAEIVPRRELPYPPGSDLEGAMLGFEKVLWFLLMPVMAFIPGFLAANELLSNVDVHNRLRLSAASVVGLMLVLAVVVRTRVLVRRRAMWAP